jgi:nicotinamidase-related amidase
MMRELPIPGFFDRARAGEIFRVPYQQRAAEALAWAKTHGLKPAASDKTKIALMAIDEQVTFCTPGSELFVAGKSGNGAVDDAVRLCEFIYQNLGILSGIYLTMDTHFAMQIFHSIYWVNEKGENPAPMTIITLDEVKGGFWKVNPAVARSVGNGNYTYLQAHALHYVQKLSDGGKYPLIIWPYHAMLGGIGHSIVPIVEEAAFFHTTARGHQTGFETKGGNFLTENYSIFAPEVLDGPGGVAIGQRNARFIKTLLDYDYVIMTGQAKSHCVAWSIQHFLDELTDPLLARKIYLLEDCTSSVVVPGVVDFSQQGDDAFRRFAAAGMNVVKSTDPIESWAGIVL